MMNQISTAIRLLSIFTLVDRDRRSSSPLRWRRAASGRRESALLRVLGASREALRRIAATEAMVLAALAAIVGGVLAIVASWCVVVFAFELPFDPPWLDLTFLIAGTFVVTALFGGVVTMGGNARSPQVALREDAA